MKKITKISKFRKNPGMTAGIALLALSLSLTGCSSASSSQQLSEILGSLASDEKDKEETDKEPPKAEPQKSDQEETKPAENKEKEASESPGNPNAGDRSAASKSQNRLILGSILQDIYENPYAYVDLMPDANGFTNPSDIESCQFSFADINQDGKEELLVSFTCTYTAGYYTGIWAVDEANGTAVEACRLGADAVYYQNGMVMEMANHNHTHGQEIWPYEILHFRSGAMEYDWVGSGWCAEAELDINREEYSEAADTDHDGIVYFLPTNDSEAVPLTTEEYQNRFRSLFPEDQKIEMNWAPLDISHINVALSDETTAPGSQVSSYKQERKREITLSGDEHEALGALLDALSIGNGAYLTRPAANWSDETVLQAIYSAFNNTSYLGINKGITGHQNGNDWRYYYSAETIDHLSESVFGHELNRQNRRSLDIFSYENGQYAFSPADGEGTGMLIDMVYEAEGKLIAEGICARYYSIYDSYAGRFQAEIKRNSDSPYGFTLLSLSALPERSGLSNLQARASSVLDSQFGNSYQASCAVDGSKATAWVEGVAGTGIGEWIEIYRADGNDLEFSAMEIYSGYQKNMDIATKNGWVSVIRAESAEGDFLGEWYLYGYEGASICPINRTVRTKSVRLTIENAVPGNKYDDICISEIVFH